MIDIVLYVLIVSHITMAFVSLYLHRHLTHRHFTLNNTFRHIIRFYLWLTDGVIAKTWVAQHRKHHRYTDIQGDPHSPLIVGKWKVISTSLVPNYIKLYGYYDTDWALEYYGKGTPEDWIEKNIYEKYPRVGLNIFLLINICLFGVIPGFLAWLVHLFWVPFCTTASITGFAHLFGYRHPDSKDNSRNLLPIGIILCGDELHNNHHLQPNNPNFAHRWFEFDLTYWYAKIFAKMGLLKFSNS